MMIQTKQVQRSKGIGYTYQITNASHSWKTKTLQDPDHIHSNLFTMFLLQLKPPNLGQAAFNFT
jgi:hypothetical protein